MTFKIKIKNSAYHGWQSFNVWPRQAYVTYHSCLRVNYPEVISVSDISRGHRTFEFESEQHYHWFLLQQ
jgi:hypothetical protein